ncbi:ribonuclease H-like domain-containing protein [Tanacetum coccineum]
MVNCNPSRTPVDTKSKLGDDGDPVSDPTLYSESCGFSTVSYFYSPKYFLGSATDHALQLFSSSTTSLVAYSDADWAGCPTTRRSNSKAEYRGGSNVVAETCWLKNLLHELHTPLSMPRDDPSLKESTKKAWKKRNITPSNKRASHTGVANVALRRNLD